MIFIKNPEQIKKMRHAGRITGEAILVARDHIRPGVTTKALDTVIREYIEKHGARPSFLGYGGFPGSACISVNEQVIHGIPSDKIVLEEGDIVKIDVGAFIDGFHGDSANTFAVGRISDEAQRLIDATKRSFELAVEAAGREGARIGDVGSAVDEYVKSLGYTTVKRYTGHGVGHELHEDPSVPNYGRPGHGPRISEGLVIAIEPMVNAGVEGVRELANGWTVVTNDGKLSAHYEHTVAITKDGPECLTKVE